MNRSDRAKQFMPFDALNGLREALRRKEEELERDERREPNEEEAAAINDALNALERGDRVMLRHYSGGRYIVTEDVAVSVMPAAKCLYLKNSRVAFGDIIELKILK